MIELTPDNIERIGAILTAERDRIAASLEGMTAEQAQTIKALRVAGCTWGRIGEEHGGGQILGRELCYRAAVVLGDDPHDEPWN